MISKKTILFIHHDQGNSGATRSLSFLLDKINTELFTVKLHCIFSKFVPHQLRKSHVQLVQGHGIYPFHSSTVTGLPFKIIRGNIVRLPQSLFFAMKLIRRQQPDIVHLNSSCLFIVALATKLINKNIKVVCHVREPLLKYSIFAAFSRYMNYFFVDHFIAIDSFTGSRLKIKNNLDIIYNTINFNEYNSSIYSDAIRSEFGIPKQAVVFLYLARIASCNGALELVRVANKLTGHHQNFHFVLAGFKEHATDKYMQKVLSEAKNNPKIHMLKFRNDVAKLIADADVLVVPFTKPHFARSVVEAAAIGKPSIGANVGGVNELIVNNLTGLLYNNEEELYTSCLKLGTDKALRTFMGNNAEAFAKKNFDNDISSEKISRLYNTLLNRNLSASAVL